MEKLQKEGLTELQTKAFEEAQKELEVANEEYLKKKYLATLSIKEIEMVKKYIATEAPWKYTECLGIKAIEEDINKSLKANKKLFLPATAYEAIYFYLSKIEGKGDKPNVISIPSIDDYISILKSINQVRNAISNDSDELKRLEFRVASFAEGIDPDNEEENKAIMAEED